MKRNYLCLVKGKTINSRFKTQLILTLCLVILSSFHTFSYASQQSVQLPSQPTWIHWEVYEIKVDKDGTSHTCTITSKGDELLVTIKTRTPVIEKTASSDKENDIVVKGHRHDFKINKTDGNVVGLHRLNYGETGKGMTMGNVAKTGPPAKVMLEPFKEVLQKLPSDIYKLMEKVLKSA
ncbi:MAG: hypothetical protein WBV94_22980 [Blastocatellia bacterium]